MLRIVGGRWGGRRLAFPTLAGVRPSPERLRETLFNWLAPLIAGARCLDLFAGSGALGLEALSRGAAEAVFVDRAPAAVKAIEDHLAALEATDRGRAYRGDALSYLESSGENFDIVFLDPPFGQALTAPVLDALDGHLPAEHRVYVEYGRRDDPAWPAAAQVLRRGKAGNVACALLRMG
jgi:16S rRNA (guanine966-N2)-methyltransferase